MSLKSKLTMGLGFLFAIMIALVIYDALNIEALSRSADRILRDNYDSLVYCKNMLLALDDMRTATNNIVLGPTQGGTAMIDGPLFQEGKSTFEKNLGLEKGNITEIHEREFVDELSKSYAIFLALAQQAGGAGGQSLRYRTSVIAAYMNARQSIVKINDLNMDAVERKNQVTRQDSRSMITAVAAVGAACLILAFFYIWYFPFYVSNSLSFLAGKMKELLDEAGIRLDIKSGDETFILLQSINLLENKLIPPRTPAKKRLSGR